MDCCIAMSRSPRRSHDPDSPSWPASRAQPRPAAPARRSPRRRSRRPPAARSPRPCSPSGSSRQATSRPPRRCSHQPGAGEDVDMLGDRRQRHRVRRRPARPTVRSPASSAVRIARRVGSASAAKIRSRSGASTSASRRPAAAAAKVNRSVDGFAAARGFACARISGFRRNSHSGLDSTGRASAYHASAKSRPRAGTSGRRGGAGPMAEEPFSERLKRLEDRIAAAKAGREGQPRRHRRRVHPGLARLADGDRARGGDGPRPRRSASGWMRCSAPGRCSWWCSRCSASPPACGPCSAPPRRCRAGRGEARADERRPRPRATRTDEEPRRTRRRSGGSGFNIHPMEQFEVHPLFGGTEVHWYTPTNATLWMALAVAARQPADDRRARAAGRWCRRAAQSIAEIGLRLRPQDDRGRRGQGGR